MTAQQAIKESSVTDSIIHVQAADIDETDLLVECDDSVDVGQVTEYWAADWRVHVHH